MKRQNNLQGLLLVGLAAATDPVARLASFWLLPSLEYLSYPQYIMQFLGGCYCVACACLYVLCVCVSLYFVSVLLSMNMRAATNQNSYNFHGGHTGISPILQICPSFFLPIYYIYI